MRLLTTRARTATPALALAAALAGGGLAGCSGAEDAVRGAARDAGCSVAQRAADEAERRARDAVSDLGADPQAARRELEAVRGALDAAVQGLGGETRQQLTRARDAVDDLLAQARRAADGTKVDDEAVAEAERQLDGAVEHVGTVC